MSTSNLEGTVMKTLLNARFFIVLAVLAVLASVLAVGRPILADSGPDAGDPEAELVAGMEEALLLDAEVIAAQEGVSVESALAVLLHQRRAGDVAKLVEADYPDQYAGMAYRGEFENPRSEILFKGEVPKLLLDTVSAEGSDFTIHGGLRFSFKELSSRSEAVIRHLEMRD